MVPPVNMIAYKDDVVFINDLIIIINFQRSKFMLIYVSKNYSTLLVFRTVLLSNFPVSTIVDVIEIQAKLCSTDAIRHLGSFLGNNDEITKEFFDKLNLISEKIDQTMKLDVQKHIKFTIKRLGFNSNFDHIFRTTNPLITKPSVQKFSEVRSKIMSQLLGCKMFQIPDHAYLSPHYGSLGLTKASILTSCGFIGGCRNAVFEFPERFPD
ncbi:hypothetical protein P9112_008801 [Eukaryota sp. TZLM1-RC]